MKILERLFGSAENAIVSYRTLRRVVGVLGIGLPVVVAVWGFFLLGGVHVEPSISDYYSLRTRDAFVGILFTIGWFLFTYHGYDRLDNRAGNVACVCALGVALFPNSGTPLEATVHFASATLLFLTLAFFSVFLFTKTAPGVAPAGRKVIRNRIYRVCGWFIVGCIVAIAVSHLVLTEAQRDAYPVVFGFETLALWAFGVSWFVKGDTLFRDLAPDGHQEPK